MKKWANHIETVLIAFLFVFCLFFVNWLIMIILIL
jgi:hypothetical protein